MKNKLILIIILGISLISFASAGWTDNLDVNLTSYYKFNETSGAVLDALGINNGTSTATFGADGIINEAYDYDSSGADERVTIPDDDTLSFGNTTADSAFSLSVWFNASLLTGNRGVISKETVGSQEYFLVIFSGALRFAIYDGTSRQSIDHDGSFTVGQWYHIVATYDGRGGANAADGLNIYVNGNAPSLTNANKDAYTAMDNTGADLYFGDRPISASFEFNGTIDEVGIWNRELTSGEVSQLYNSGAGITYGVTEETETNIQLLSPSDDSLITSTGSNFTIVHNISSSSYNWTNSTFYIWDEDSTIFNKTTASISGNNNTTILFIDDFVLGNYIWNGYSCFGNATFSNCSWSNNGNFTFTIGATADAQYYDPFVHETEHTFFQLNLTLLSGSTIYDQRVYYNGTFFTGTSTSLGSNQYSLDLGMDVPTINTGDPSELRDFLWSIIFKREDGTYFFQNFTEYQQNVTSISLTRCNSGNMALNFTNWNEENNTRMYPFDFYGTFNYWLGEGSIYKNLSVTNISINETTFCISNASLEFHTDAQIQYEKDNFVKRSYYLINATLDNVIDHIKLFSLASTASTSFIIDIVDQNQIPIPEVYIRIQRYYPGLGTFETIEMGQTDTQGSTIGHFEAETEDYKIIVTSGNSILFESGVQKVFCRESPCTLTFQVGSTDLTRWNDAGNITNFIWSLEFNETSNIWTYSYIDLSGTSALGRLNVYKEGGIGKSTICNTNSSSTAATLTCNVTGNTGTIYAAAYIDQGEEILVYLKSAIVGTLKSVFGKEGLFLACLIIMVLAFAGLWNPAVGIILVVFGVIMINFIGLASFGAITIWGLILIALIILWGLNT